MNNFKNSLKKLVSHGCNASSFLVYQKSKLVHYETTNMKFQEAYLDAKKQVENCHLATVATKRILEHKPYTLIWDQILPTNEDSFYLNELRLKHEYCHGISFLNPINEDILFALTLVGKKDEIGFPYKVLRNKRIICEEFIKISYAYNLEIIDQLSQ